MTQTTAPTSPEISARRPIKARQSRWAAVSAAWLARRGVTPNAISIGSIFFCAIAGGCLIAARYVLWVPALLLYLAAAAGIQLRLICNLLDGMVAIEGGKKSKSGEIFNDFPDRLADPIVLAAAGYAAAGLPWAVDLGWLAAAMALMTAYTRVLGRSIGSGIYFTGPMAKQHRMAVLTGACVAAAGLAYWHRSAWALWAALVVIVLGCVVTVARRLKLIVADLERR